MGPCFSLNKDTLTHCLHGHFQEGEIVFVHYYQEVQSGSDLVVRAKGSPFKSTIVTVDFKEEGIMYTVSHHRQLHARCHISDFVVMVDGSYRAEFLVGVQGSEQTVHDLRKTEALAPVLSGANVLLVSLTRHGIC